MSVGYIYVFYSGKESLFKIGASRYPKKRYQNLKYDKFSSLGSGPVLDALCGDHYYAFEKLIHHKYSSKRFCGEWFNLTNENLHDIERLAIGEAGISGVVHYPIWEDFTKDNRSVEERLELYLNKNLYKG